MVKTDITQMTAQEIEEYLQQRKDEAAKKLQENGMKWKEELEVYCQKKYGVSLAVIFTASDKAPKPSRQFKNPADGSVYTYSGRGKVPGWLKGSDGKPNLELEILSN
jgi:DNA-binding protein H-NS